MSPGGGAGSDGGLRPQELLLVLECWISHWRVMSAERRGLSQMRLRSHSTPPHGVLLGPLLPFLPSFPKQAAF